MKTNAIKLLSAAALGVMFQVSNAGNIVGINASVLPNQQRVIKVKFDSGAVEPTGFVTSNPSRIALDFPATGVQLAQPSQSFNDTFLRQLAAAQGNGNARVLLTLSQDGQYNAQVKGNEVWIYVNEAPVTNTAVNRVAAPAQQSEPVYTGNSSAVNIDFKKGSNNSGIVEYSSGYSGQPKVKVQNDRLVITLKNYPLAAKDQRTFDVTDFSTPVRDVNVKRLGNDTQITIRNQGNWEHKITQSNGRNVVQITPVRNVTTAQIGRKAAKSYKGKRISLDFQNVDVRTVLQILAKESGMNIVASDTVQGKITLSLRDVPWDQALDLVLDARNLGKSQHGNIINVLPNEEIDKKTEDALAAQQKLEKLRPLITQSFQLKYKNVDEFKKILKIEDNNSSTNTQNTILSERGSALLDPSTNTLIITDNQLVIEKFQRLIAELDVPAKQVMVEARIVEAADGVSRDLGVKFGVNGSRGRTSFGSSLSDTIGQGSVLAGPNVNLPATAAVNSIALVRAFSSGALGLEISALETENRTKVISNPRVLTQDRKEAEIKQGFQIPYQTRDGSGAYKTDFKDAVLSLKVTPRITPDSKVILDITINKDDIASNYTNIDGEPALSTKQVKTQAMIEDGGTLVVGGVYQETFANTVRKVPVLGDLPVLGNLFKSRGRKHERNELLFFITPRIMGGETSVLRY